MSSSAAERKRKQRDKLKEEGKYEDYKRKQSYMQRQRRKKRKNTMTFDEKEELKKKRRIEQREYRLKKRMLGNPASQPEVTTPSVTYKSPCSFGKAIARAKRGLPQSPRKRKAIVTKLASAYVPDILLSPPTPRQENSPRIITEEVKATVIAFFNSDSVSYQMPGTRDYVILRSDNGKEKIQKRYLFLTLGESYQHYKEEYPRDAKIGFTRFCELRPKHVFLRAETPENLCLCIYHENMKLLLTSVPGISNSTGDLIRNVVCNENEMKCMMSECNVCGNARKYDQYIDSAFPDLSDADITYQQWIKDEEGHTSRKKMCGSVTEVLDTLRGKLPQFLKHAFINKRQASHFESLKKSLATDTMIMQIDFSENYCFHYQDEIQSAHWESNSCTLYTAIIYFISENGELDHESYVVVSDYMNHDKSAVAKFNSIIMGHFKKNHPGFSRIQYQSDGTAQHFKQKFSLSLITLQPEEISWNFSATAHGKGPIDGLGGTLKRRVREATRARQIDPRTAAQFAKCAQQLCPKVHTIYCSENDVNAEKSELLNLWYPNGKEISNIPDTRSYHYFHAL